MKHARPAAARILAPIWMQICLLVVAVLIAAQVVTFGLTLLMPPAPPQQHSLAEIAEVLQGGAGFRAARPLVRTVERAPPSLNSPGWVVSPRATAELAGFLDAPLADVRLLFYAPPPLAGTEPPPPRGPAPFGPPPEPRMLMASYPGSFHAPARLDDMGVASAAPALAPAIARPGADVEGELVAAWRTPAGWVTVRPKPEGFPNSWQQRVLLWFALSLALVTPPGCLLARRLAAPLQRFADAAERLGRDPTADLPQLGGPAEIGSAASAFNLMRVRLKRYVEDRTGMIGAISHDLRTPLSRMRFKLERTPAAASALAGDVDQMEAMIASVLGFMCDEFSGGPRETADLRSVLECVVADAGERAELAPGPPAAAHVDLLAIQRAFDHLIANAVQYGGRARVRMATESDGVVVEVADEGPGLSEEELEQAFRPFYRGALARSCGAPGVGLGLAVSRSILRAHGGELTLVSGEAGLTARARIPAATR
jgi:signal transduction histidine kinase